MEGEEREKIERITKPDEFCTRKEKEEGWQEAEGRRTDKKSS